MFIHINDTNYFIIPDDKTPQQIFDEIFSRMNITFISYEDRRKMISDIKKELNKLKLMENS